MRILEIDILTSNLKSALDFYNQTLGFSLISKTTQNFSVQAGNSKITFRQSKKEVDPVYHFAFNIPNNQLYEGREWVSKRATIIPAEQGKVIADFDNWNAKAFYFYDPVGNVLECLTRYSLDNQRSTEFNTQSFLSVSEIAIVTRDVPALADHIHNEHGLPFFTKQPRHDNFTVMGDDDGLLIISEEDRHWFPTQHLAKPFPVTVCVSDLQRVSSLVFNEDVQIK